MSLAVEQTLCLNVSHYRHAPAETIAAGMLAACAGGCLLPAEHLRAVPWVVLVAIEHQWHRVQFVAEGQQAAAAVVHQELIYWHHEAPLVAAVEQAAAAGRFVAVVRGAGHASAKHWVHAA